MDLLHEYIEDLINDDNEEINNLLSKKVDAKKRTVNLIILFAFITLIGIYYSISLLLMFFTLILFVYWIIQVEFLSMKRYYKEDDLRWKLYLDKAQKLVFRKKYTQCVNMYYTYHRIDESIDNLKLFLLVLFIENNTERYIQLYKRNEVEGDIFLSMFKYSLAKEKKLEELKKLLITRNEIDCLFFMLIDKKDNECFTMLKSSRNIKIQRILQSINSSEE